MRRRRFPLCRQVTSRIMMKASCDRWPDEEERTKMRRKTTPQAHNGETVGAIFGRRRMVGNIGMRDEYRHARGLLGRRSVCLQ